MIAILSKWRHCKTGNVYTVVGIGNSKNGAEWVRSVFYRGDDASELYSRPVVEWAARFERVES